MKLKRGSTSVRRLVFIGDSSSTTGAGIANLTHASAGLVCWYFAGDLSNDIQVTLVAGTLGTYTSGGFVAVDNTNMPGWYEIGIPNAALDGGNEVCIQIRGATNMVPVNIYIELDAVDYQDATAFGLSRLDATVSSRSALDATGVRSAIGLSSANLDTQLSTIDDFLDTEIAAIKAKTDTIPSFPANFASLAITVGGAVTAGTVSDKTGYSLSQSFPANFASLGINASGHVSRVTLTDTCTTNTDMRGTNNAMLAASYTAPDNTSIAAIKAKTDTIPSWPSNFASLAITVGGAVTAGTVGDKTGYSLSVSPPTASMIASQVRTELTTELGRIDVATSTRLATAGYTAPDNSGIGSIGTVVTTIAGYLDTEVAAIKATTDRLDTAMQLDGSVYRFTTNALELAPTGSGGGGSSLTGANTVTITVNYASQPVEGAKVRLSRVGETGIAETNASGQVVFSADNGNWTIAITKPGFSFAPTTLIVDGNEAVAYTLTAVTIAASDAGRRTVYYTCYGSNGEILVGTTVYAKCIKAPGSGLALMGTDQSATSDSNGVAAFANRIIGATYEFSMGTGKRITATIPSGSSAIALESIVGK